jgi:eukaryotic-like serine/threonine-protein kinase
LDRWRVGDPVTAPDPLVQALSHRYEIERELGAGGMAIVYLAHDLRHDRKVALKVFRPEVGAAVGAERFLREIRLVASLAHPHILPLHDSGEAGEYLYYVTPYIEGESLRERIRREGPLPVADVARILHDVADALSAAHARGIVHRDLKPGNVLLSGRHALLADFGVAKALDAAACEGEEELTAFGMTVGTPHYMAPEQAAGEPDIDHRADLYALGILGYEMLTGKPPFEGTSPQAVLAAHLTRPPEPIAGIREDVPPALADAIMRCLEKTAGGPLAGGLGAGRSAGYHEDPDGRSACGGALDRAPGKRLAAAGRRRDGGGGSARRRGGMDLRCPRSRRGLGA